MGKPKRQINKKVKDCTLFIEGMHCASCEILIEKKLLKKDSIHTANASLSGNRVQLRYLGERPNVTQLNKEFQDLGYTFSDKKIIKKDNPLLTFSNGRFQGNPEKLKRLGGSLVVVISLIIAFFVFENLELGQYVSVDSSSTLPAFFLLGLIAGISSCAALIGGLLLSMIKQWNELYIDADSQIEKSQPHIMFHFGRLVSFALLGGFLGMIGGVIELSNPIIFSILTIIVSIIMLILGLQMLEVSWAQQLHFTVPKVLTVYAANEKNFQGKYMPLAIGSLTFFLPCGFTLIAQTIALTSGSFFLGASIMSLFALGTFIPLLGISMSGLVFNRKPHFTAQFNMVAGLIIVFFVIYNINGQLNVLGFPSLSDISFTSSTSIVKAEKAAITVEGVQLLTVTAEGFEYIPTSSTVLKANVPTQLVVNNTGIQGCGSFIAARGLIPNFISLQPGTNTIDLGSPAAGTYKLTCSMGMVRPVTIEFI